MSLFNGTFLKRMSFFIYRISHDKLRTALVEPKAFQFTKRLTMVMIEVLVSALKILLVVCVLFL